ncbi:MAG: DUF3854 domain-containing protein, partial [Methylomicrobium sp.]|nr:DUF3854 domain-containing protein [Methylomicrobium sp.]
MGHRLSGIPGFYKATGPRGGRYWSFERQPGYYIPVRDVKGRIQALQRRMDDPGRGGKYKLFSGHKNLGGCSCGTPAHVARPTELKDVRVWITEGPLKANVASRYLSAVVVGALTAPTWRPAIPVVEALGITEVVLSYDQDLRANPDVGRAYRTLKEELKKHGLAVSRAVWDEKKGGKGVDDALATGAEVQVVRV